jgi:hypothetical protein
LNGATGGGGRIKVFYHSLNTTGSSISVTGDSVGTIYYEFFNSIPDAPNLSSPENDTYLNDSTPYLIWNPAYDGDLDPLTYFIEVDEIGGDWSTLVAGNHTQEGVLSWEVDSSLPDGTYQWRVFANDSYENGSISEIWAFTIDTVTKNYTVLKQGWNLISIPFLQSDTSLDSVLDDIQGYYDAVQRYDNSDNVDHWKHHKEGKPYGDDLTDVNERMGFWIYITQPGDTIFSYNGTRPTENQTITLYPGWNMVGYPSLRNRTRDTALNNLTFGNQVDSIWTYNATTMQWVELTSSDSFDPGRGYWIHAKVECIWKVPLL